ncbi:MAG: hypothetical protein R3B13_37205 [Polyangiaceae bacterium]
MDPRALVDELTKTARGLGIEVRVVAMRLPTRGSGGLCRVNGKSMILLDQKQPAVDRAGTLAEAITDSGLAFDREALTETARAVLEIAARRRTRLASGAEPLPRQGLQSLLGPKPGLRRTRARR